MNGDRGRTPQFSAKSASRDGVSAIILDLQELTFIDSTGLLALVRARERARANGRRLILIGARPSARRLFELTCTGYLLDDQDVRGVIKQVHPSLTSLMGKTLKAGHDADV